MATFLSELTGFPGDVEIAQQGRALEAATNRLNAMQNAMDKGTDQTVKPEQDLGTLTWTGSAPGGTVTKKYRWAQTGKLVTIYWHIRGSNQGAAVGAVSAPLPADCPVPALFSTVTNDSWAAIGAGAIIASANANLNAGQAGVYKVNPQNYQLRITSTAPLAARTAIGQVHYLTE